MLQRFARDQPMQGEQDPLREVNTTAARSRVIDLLAQIHPYTIQHVDTVYTCVRCKARFTLRSSIGQRQCMVHPRKWNSITGDWPCCMQDGSRSPGCVPGDHAFTMVDEPTRYAWVVPSWIELTTAPLVHTIVPPDGAEGWTRVPLRVASDRKTDEEEHAYANWEKKDGNIRLVSTTDAHRFIFLRIDGPRPQETRTNLSDVLAAQGNIVRYVQ